MSIVKHTVVVVPDDGGAGEGHIEFGDYGIFQRVRITAQDMNTVGVTVTDGDDNQDVDQSYSGSDIDYSVWDDLGYPPVRTGTFTVAIAEADPDGDNPSVTVDIWVQD